MLEEVRTRLAGTAIGALALAGCATVPPTEPVVAYVPHTVATATPSPAPPPAPKPPEVPSGMQWLYGSAEGAAASIETYRALERFVADAVRDRPAKSVVLEAGTSLAAASRMPCGKKPFAIILDADETALQNQGLEYGLAARGVSSDGKLVDRWQERPRTQAPAMPGAPASLRRIRSEGVTVIFNTNRDSPGAAATAATLSNAGVGPAEHLKTLFLRGDVDGKSGKDGRRWHIASRYCVIALVGDQMGDFTDLLNDKSLSPLERRRLASTGAIGGLWGNGWFLLSNPVYGPGLKGTIEEVFAPENRWDGER